MAELERVLSFRAIFLITINALLGTGIFFSPAVAAGLSGTASIWAWVVMGFVAVYVSMVFAELTGMYPTSGGVYDFCKKAFNLETSFFVGYLSLLTGYIGISMLVVGAVNYILPDGPHWLAIAVALILIFIFHYVAYTGLETSAVMLSIFSVIMLAAIIGISIPGALNLNPAHFADIFSFGAAGLGFAAIFGTAFIVAESYFGWESATFLAGETKDGSRTVPKALIFGTIFIALLNIFFVITSIGAVGAKALAEHASSPFSFLASTYFGPDAQMITGLIVYISIIGCVAGGIVTTPRLISAMAQDKLFVSQLSKIHPVHKTPANAIIFQGVLCSLLVVFSQSSYQTLLQLLIPLALLQYGTVVVALVRQRYKQPHAERTFKIPGPNWLSLLLIPFFLFLTIMWASKTANAVQILLLGGSLLLVAVPLFLLIKVYYDPAFFIKLNDFFAWLVYMTEQISLPADVKKEILLLMGDLHGKRVLEYGCSVGTLTEVLAEKVSKHGRIYATNISSKELEISRKRIMRRGHEHVVFIHDEHQVNRIHPDIPEVDAILSFGMLSAMQDVRKVLNEMDNVLVSGGKICMVDFTNYFHIIPDVEWITTDAHIKQLFKECGFSVTVTRRKGKLWNYVYIHGVKLGDSASDMVYI